MSTYPTILTVVGNVPPEQQNFGPFVDGVSRFVFGFREADGLITVAESVDNGENWVEVDGGNAKVREASFPMFAVTPDDAFPVVPLVHLVYLDVAGNFTYSTFNVSTRLWGADVASVLGYTAGPPSPSLDDNSFFIRHRSFDDKIIMFVSSVIEAVPGARWRCQWASFEIGAATWSGYTQVGTAGGDNVNYYSNACVAGDGFTHFFYRYVPFNTAIAAELRHISLSDADVLSAAQLVLSGDQANFVPFRRSSAPVSRPVSGGVQVLVPIRAQTTLDYFLYAISGLSAEQPTWTVATIATGARKQLGQAGDTAAPLCVYDDNGTLFAFWGFTSFDAGGSALSALIRQALSAGGVVWDTATLFYTQPLAGYSVVSSNIGGRQVGSGAFMAAFDDGFVSILNYWEIAGVGTPEARIRIRWIGKKIKEVC